MLPKTMANPSRRAVLQFTAVSTFSVTIA